MVLEGFLNWVKLQGPRSVFVIRKKNFFFFKELEGSYREEDLGLL